MISPGFNSCEHTINTLRYADRYVIATINQLATIIDYVKCFVYTCRVKELSSNNRGAGDGGVVFSAPPPLSDDPCPESSSYDEEQEPEEPPIIVPDSPVHADLQYLHRSLQKVHLYIKIMILCM